MVELFRSAGSLQFPGMTDALPIILILGPTAGGKTELAVGLAQRLPGGGECIWADSIQVYRGMASGHAQPTHRQPAAVEPPGTPIAFDLRLLDPVLVHDLGEFVDACFEVVNGTHYDALMKADGS